MGRSCKSTSGDAIFGMAFMPQENALIKYVPQYIAPSQDARKELSRSDVKYEPLKVRGVGRDR